jgi:rod shape-determining protein MreC
MSNRIATALEDVDWEDRFTILPADVVIPVDSDPFRDSMVIAAGHSVGVRPGALVISHQYVVGRVVEVSAFTSRIVLISDPAFKIGALCIRTGDISGEDSEVGVAQGVGDGWLEVRWIQEPRGLRSGDFAVTTLDPIAGIPKGLLLGRIVVVDETEGPFATITVQAGVNGNLLERVQLLLPKEESR